MENIKVYYINLDKRTERNTDVLEKLNYLGFKDENIKRFSAVNGKNIKNDLKKKNYMNNEIIDILKNKKINIRLGELGASLSHYFIFEDIIKDESISDDTIIFIFEDDFFLNINHLSENPFEKFINDLKTFDKNYWDLIFIGGRFKEGFTINNINESKFYERIYKNFYKKIYGLVNKQYKYHTDRTLHSYIIQKKTAIKLKEFYKYIYEKKNIFVADHILEFIDNINEIDEEYRNIIKYDYFPHLFYSPINYKTDIQHDFSIINTSELFINDI